MTNWLVVAFLCLVLIALLTTHKTASTCLLLYGGSDQWQPVIEGVTSVLPGTEVVVLSDPEIDYVAYVDAMQDLSSRFQRLICQIPNQRAMRVLRNRQGVTVSVASDPSLAQASVTCNIVACEQAMVNAMLPYTRTQKGRKLLISSSPCRVPTGWSQMQATGTDGFTGSLGVSNKAAGMKLEVIMISNPDLVSLKVVQALKAANPSCAICAATYPNVSKMSELACQVTPHSRDVGRLAACMAVMGSGYMGQQTVVVEPKVLLPEVSLERCQVTSLHRLKAVTGLI